MIYKKLIKNRISDEFFIKTCQTSNSMASAAVKLNLHFNSFKRRALELGCYHVNQSGKGTKKSSPKIPLDDIITYGKYPHYQSYKLKKRLFEEGVKQPECEVCKISIWQNKPLTLELHHVDGNRHNHAIENLMLLCPNCHSQTPTFRAKNKKI